MKEFDEVLFDKCLSASEVLFSDLLGKVIEKEQLSPETVEIIKEDNAKRLYNLSRECNLNSVWSSKLTQI